MAHGLECRLSKPLGLRRNVRKVDCDCVACHCETHVPGGFLGCCLQCGRPLVVNGRVVRRRKAISDREVVL